MLLSDFLSTSSGMNVVHAWLILWKRGFLEAGAEFDHSSCYSMGQCFLHIGINNAKKWIMVAALSSIAPTLQYRSSESRIALATASC